MSTTFKATYHKIIVRNANAHQSYTRGSSGPPLWQLCQPSCPSQRASYGWPPLKPTPPGMICFSLEHTHQAINTPCPQRAKNEDGLCTGNIEYVGNVFLGRYSKKQVGRKSLLTASGGRAVIYLHLHTPTDHVVCTSTCFVHITSRDPTGKRVLQDEPDTQPFVVQGTGISTTNSKLTGQAQS